MYSCRFSKTAFYYHGYGHYQDDEGNKNLKKILSADVRVPFFVHNIHFALCFGQKVDTQMTGAFVQLAINIYTESPPTSNFL